MQEQPIYLKSLHSYNFRHSKENPKVIGFVMFTPEGYSPVHVLKFYTKVITLLTISLTLHLLMDTTKLLLRIKCITT